MATKQAAGTKGTAARPQAPRRQGAMQGAWQSGIAESQRQARYRDGKWDDGF